MDDPNFDRDIHIRLIAGDPTAPDDLASRYLEPVRKHVQARAYRRGIQDHDLVNDATVDSVFDYIRNPKKFNPEKSGLLSYLKFAAERDLANAVSKHFRRTRHEELTDDVELTTQPRNKIGVMETIRRNIETQAIDNIEGRKEVRAAVSTITKDIDQKLLQLIADGVRKTETFAAELGITGLPITDQRRIVKQHKDRLNQQLKRWGRKHNGEG